MFKASQRVLNRLKSVWERLKSVLDAPSEPPRAPKSAQSSLIYHYLVFHCSFLMFLQHMTRAFYRCKRVYLGRIGCVWGVLGATWGDLEASWRRLGASVGSLGTSLGRLGASLVRLRASLGRRGGAWSHFIKYAVKLQWKWIFGILEVYEHRL